MLRITCWIATAILTAIACLIWGAGSFEDRRDGTLVFALAALTGGLTLYCHDPRIAWTLRMLLAIEVAGLATVLIRARPR